MLQKCFARFIQTTVRCNQGKNKKFQNNFKFKNLISSESDQTHDYFNRTVSADLLQQSENRKALSKKQRKPAIGYKGEVLYGVHPVYLALTQQKRQFFHLFMKDFSSTPSNSEKTNLKEEIKKLGHSLGIQTTFVTTRDLNHLAPEAVHQGICLDASAYPLMEYEETDGIKFETSCSDMPLWLVLDEIQDPMNVGAILRSSYYFGVDKVFITAENSCKLSPTVSKASSGALEILNISSVYDLASFLKKRKSDGWDIVSTAIYKPHIENAESREQHCSSLSDYNMSKPTILILGNENKGISPSVMSLCDRLVTVYPPKKLHLGIDSLNVSVATGILLYHVLCMRKLSIA